MRKIQGILLFVVIATLCGCGSRGVDSTDTINKESSSSNSTVDEANYVFDEELSEYGKQIVSSHQDDSRIIAYQEGVNILKNISSLSGEQLSTELQKIPSLLNEIQTESTRTEAVKEAGDFQEAIEQHGNKQLKETDIKHLYSMLVDLVIEVAAEEYVDPYPVNVDSIAYVSMMESLGYRVEQEERIDNTAYMFYENGGDDYAAALYQDKNGTVTEVAVKTKIIPYLAQTDAEFNAFHDLDASSRNETAANYIYEKIHEIDRNTFINNPDPKIGFILSSDELAQIYEFLIQYSKDDWIKLLENEQDIDYLAFYIQTANHVVDMKSVTGGLTIQEIFGIDWYKRQQPFYSVTETTSKKYNSLDELAKSLNNTYAYICIEVPEYVNDTSNIATNDSDILSDSATTSNDNLYGYQKDWYKNVESLSQGNNVMTFYWLDDGTVTVEINGVSMYDFHSSNGQENDLGYTYYVEYPIDYENFSICYYPAEESSPIQLTGGDYIGYYSR